MPNTKTGTTWAPDIRPGSIETFTETYTPDAGTEQTLTYKRVADHPILNGIRDIKAFFTTHAGAVWYNLQERQTLLAKLREMDEEIKVLNTKTPVSQAELLTFAYSINVQAFRAYKVGRIITFHAECIVASGISYGGVICTFKNPYRPGINYIVIPVRNSSSAFSEIATLWVRSNGNCEFYSNGNVGTGTRIYIQGEFAY